MLKINALKINVNTNKGLYGFETRFDAGLNIIRGDNSSGKSTLFQSILYGLGMEELVGGRNDKAMQSVLKNEVLNSDRTKAADVLESSILLEIQNDRPITIERYVRSETKDSKLITVYHGALLTGDKKELPSDRMYVHDPGSATDVKFGFFAFLESFLGLNLPHVQYNDGGKRKLYLQTLFPAFVVEQKVGWSDFLATIPFYNLKDKEKRAIEFVLGLDSWSIEEKKQELNRTKHQIESKWNNEYLKLKELARRSATDINGLDNSPFIINSPERIFLTYSTPESTISLSEYISHLEDQLLELEDREIPKIEEVSKEKEAELKEVTESYNLLVVQHNDIQNKRNSTLESINTIQERLTQIEEELTHNKHHLKIKKMASDDDLSLAKDVCPTCTQVIMDSLLPVNLAQNSMNIEQNIEYLDAQKSVAKIYLDNHRKELNSFDQKIQMIESSLTSRRDSIRLIKRDLVSDDRLPSVELIEKRIKLKNRLDFYVSVDSDFDRSKEAFISLSEDWKTLLGDFEGLPKESFSKQDYKKLKFINNEFLNLLRKFDYGSKSLKDLSISKDKLIPVAENQYNIRYNMRLDSSASDLVRAIAAYTCSLYKVSEQFKTNHLGLIIFDEPGTQETAISTLREILLSLQSYNAQSLVFASFKQSESDFMETTEGIRFHLIKSSEKKFIIQERT